MSDFLTGLVERSMGLASSLQPKLAPRFSAVPELPGEDNNPASRDETSPDLTDDQQVEKYSASSASDLPVHPDEAASRAHVHPAEELRMGAPSLAVSQESREPGDPSTASDAAIDRVPGHPPPGKGPGDDGRWAEPGSAQPGTTAPRTDAAERQDHAVAEVLPRPAGVTRPVDSIFEEGEGQRPSSAGPETGEGPEVPESAGQSTQPSGKYRGTVPPRNPGVADRIATTGIADRDPQLENPAAASEASPDPVTPAPAGRRDVIQRTMRSGSAPPTFDASLTGIDDRQDQVVGARASGPTVVNRSLNSMLEAGERERPAGARSEIGEDPQAPESAPPGASDHLAPRETTGRASHLSNSAAASEAASDSVTSAPTGGRDVIQRTMQSGSAPPGTTAPRTDAAERQDHAVAEILSRPAGLTRSLDSMLEAGEHERPAGARSEIGEVAQTLESRATGASDHPAPREIKVASGNSGVADRIATTGIADRDPQLENPAAASEASPDPVTPAPTGGRDVIQRTMQSGSAPPTFDASPTGIDDRRDQVVGARASGPTVVTRSLNLMLEAGERERPVGARSEIGEDPQAPESAPPGASDHLAPRETTGRASHLSNSAAASEAASDSVTSAPTGGRDVIQRTMRSGSAPPTFDASPTGIDDRQIQAPAARVSWSAGMNHNLDSMLEAGERERPVGAGSETGEGPPAPESAAPGASDHLAPREITGRASHLSNSAAASEAASDSVTPAPTGGRDVIQRTMRSGSAPPTFDASPTGIDDRQDQAPAARASRSTVVNRSLDSILELGEGQRPSPAGPETGEGPQTPESAGPSTKASDQRPVKGAPGQPGVNPRLALPRMEQASVSQAERSTESGAWLGRVPVPSPAGPPYVAQAATVASSSNSGYGPPSTGASEQQKRGVAQVSPSPVPANRSFDSILQTLERKRSSGATLENGDGPHHVASTGPGPTPAGRRGAKPSGPRAAPHEADSHSAGNVAATPAASIDRLHAPPADRYGVAPDGVHSSGRTSSRQPRHPPQPDVEGGAWPLAHDTPFSGGREPVPATSGKIPSRTSGQVERVANSGAPRVLRDLLSSAAPGNRSEQTRPGSETSVQVMRRDREPLSVPHDLEPVSDPRLPALPVSPPSTQSIEARLAEHGADHPRERVPEDARSEPVVRVHIGHLEVRAAAPAPVPSSAPVADSSRPVRPALALSLGDYLARRRAGGQ